MNIYGIGFDLVEIARIDKILKSKIGDSFLKHIYSEDERDLFGSKKDPTSTAAANFAAKEAFAKAIGTGFRNLHPNEISVLRDKLGKPFIKLSERMSKKYDGMVFELSVTHTQTTAGAVIIAFKAEADR